MSCLECNSSSQHLVGLYEFFERYPVLGVSKIESMRNVKDLLKRGMFFPLLC